MTLQELLHNKYLAKMNKLTPKEWEEIKYIAKCEKKTPAEIVYRTIYFTFEDYKNFDSNDEFYQSNIEARENHYIKEKSVKYGYTRYYLTRKGMKAYQVI